MAEVKARGVDPVAIKKIDELAKLQGISRSTFIAHLIENYAALEEFKNFEQRYQSCIDKCIAVIENNTKVLNKVLEIAGDEQE